MCTFAASSHSGLQYLLPAAAAHLQVSRAHLLLFAWSAISTTSFQEPHKLVLETSVDSTVLMVKGGQKVWWTKSMVDKSRVDKKYGGQKVWWTKVGWTKSMVDKSRVGKSMVDKSRVGKSRV